MSPPGGMKRLAEVPALLVKGEGWVGLGWVVRRRPLRERQPADDLMRGGDGNDTMLGDSNAFTGDAAGAGDDRLDGGPDAFVKCETVLGAP